MKIEKIKSVAKTTCKYLIFTVHNILRYYTLYGWVVDKRVLILQAIVMVSWYLNNNQCLISQIEKYLFKETFLNNELVHVDKVHRYEMYSLFVMGCLFHLKH